MKKFSLSLSLSLLIFFDFSLAIIASPAPSPSSPENTDVFISKQDGYAAYRIPAIATAPDGTLLAFAEARKYTLGDPGAKGNDIDLVMKRSTDGGRTWSAMQVIEDPGEFWTAGNPATVIDRSNGRIFLHYLRCKPGCSSNTARPQTDDIRNLVRTSDDNGKTWSEPADITEAARDMADPDWRVSVFGPCGAIQDQKGRPIAAVWKVDKPWGVFAVYSEDHGKTWRRGEPVPGLEGDECQVVELSDGRILFDIRQRKGTHRWLAESADGGKTWGAARQGLPATPCCCSILRDGKRILWSGPLGPGRSKLVLRASADDGKTFPAERLVSEEPTAYSALTILKDGAIGLLWERGNYKFLTFTRLERDFVRDK